MSLPPQRESLVVGDEEEATGFKGDGGMVDIVGPRDSAGQLIHSNYLTLILETF